MQFAFRLLLVLIFFSPAFLVSDTLLIHGILTALTAFLVFVVALSIRPGEAAFFSSTIRPYAIGGFLFALVIALQLIPLPASPWRHPIWTSAETALGEAVWGSITISPGDTLIAFIRCLTAIGLVAVVAATAIDRRRAELLLFALLAIATFAGLILVVHNGGGFIFLGEIGSTGPRPAIALSTSIAAVLSLTTIVYAMERYETRHSRPDFGVFGVGAALACGLLGFVLALITVVLFMPKTQLLPTLMGIATFLLIFGFRRAGFSAKLGFLISVATLGIPAVFAFESLGTNVADISLRFAGDPASPLAEAARRILGDNGWLGSGAGTFGNLLPLYAEASQQTSDLAAPTSVVNSMTGFGLPLTLIFIAAAVLATARLVYGALNRGRDSFFTAAAASCLTATIVEAFIDTSLLQSASLILVLAVLGLGIAQSRSRTAH